MVAESCLANQTRSSGPRLAILERLNKEEVERIRNAPGDRKAGYVAKPITKKKPPANQRESNE